MAKLIIVKKGEAGEGSSYSDPSGIYLREEDLHSRRGPFILAHELFHSRHKAPLTSSGKHKNISWLEEEIDAELFASGRSGMGPFYKEVLSWVPFIRGAGLTRDSFVRLVRKRAKLTGASRKVTNRLIKLIEKAAKAEDFEIW